jgi:hypothetical protein
LTICLAALSNAVTFTEFVVIANAGKACINSFKTSVRQTKLTGASVSKKGKKKEIYESETSIAEKFRNE